MTRPHKAGARNGMLPFRFTKRGASLLNLQCWLWGQDIRRAEGNLLLAYGLQRLRPPAGVSGCSQYSAKLTDGSCLKLWGFGLYCGGEYGVYLNRYEFTPRLATLQDGWTAKLFARSKRAPMPACLPGTLRWIADYEAWVLATAGPEYRLSAAAPGPETDASATRLSAAWQDFAGDLEHWHQSAMMDPPAANAPYRQEAHTPDKKNSCDLIMNPLGTLAL